MTDHMAGMRSRSSFEWLTECGSGSLGFDSRRDDKLAFNPSPCF